MPERTRSLACKNKTHASKSPQVRRKIRPSLRNGFNSYFVLSLVIGLSCHHPRCDAQASSPSWHQRRDVRTTRLRRPRQRRSSHGTTASIASRTQRSWRSRNAPLFGYRMARAC